jgi:hypothetical protein
MPGIDGAFALFVWNAHVLLGATTSQAVYFLFISR